MPASASHAHTLSCGAPDSGSVFGRPGGMTTRVSVGVTLGVRVGVCVLVKVGVWVGVCVKVAVGVITCVMVGGTGLGVRVMGVTGAGGGCIGLQDAIRTPSTHATSKQTTIKIGMTALIL